MGTKYICRSIMSRDIIRCSKLRLLIITLWREGAILSGGSEQVTRHLPEVSYILFRVSLRGRQCAIRWPSSISCRTLYKPEPTH